MRCLFVRSKDSSLSAGKENEMNEIGEKGCVSRVSQGCLGGEIPPEWRSVMLSETV